MEKKHIKLLILAKSIDGGTGSFVSNLGKIKNKLVFNSKIFIFEKPSFRKIKDKNFIFIHPKNFYPVHYSLVSSLKYLIFDIFYTKNIIQKERIDIILSVNYYSNILVSLTNKIFSLKQKIILTHHNNLSLILEKRCSWVIKSLLKIILPFLFQNSINVVVSQSLARELSNIFRIKNIKVIYNGIDIKRNRKIITNNKRNIISVGRTDEQKDFFTLLEAFSLLKEKIKAKLILVGNGKKLKDVKTYIKKLKLTKDVKLLKWKNNISKYLNQSSLFVFSSNYEGFPFVLIEAMSQGLPIISTNTPFGPSEILDNGKYGILVPMKDPKAMADAMYEILTDEKKYNYYAQKSLERAKYFSLDKMLNAYKKVILDVTNKP